MSNLFGINVDNQGAKLVTLSINQRLENLLSKRALSVLAALLQGLLLLLKISVVSLKVLLVLNESI